MGVKSFFKHNAPNIEINMFVAIHIQIWDNWTIDKASL
jgi:hypothetical protein